MERESQFWKKNKRIVNQNAITIRLDWKCKVTDKITDKETNLTFIRMLQKELTRKTKLIYFLEVLLVINNCLWLLAWAIPQH